MGGCASKPKALDRNEAPVPVENVPEKAEETKTEEPLVDLSEAAAEAPKESVSEEAKPAESSTEAPKVDESVKAVEEPTKEEEDKKDEVAQKPQAAAAVGAAPKPEDN